MWPAGALAATTPAVTTGGASVGPTTATMNGTVNPDGAPTTYYFQIGLSAVYTATSAVKSAGSGTRPVSATGAINGLLPATLYHYRLVASSSAGATLGKDRTFTTSGPPLPTPTTGEALVAGPNTAVVAGSIGTNGDVTTWAFQFGLTTGYGAETFGINAPASAAPVPVSAELTGLESGAIFHYRLVTFHAVGPPTYGADATFMTFPTPALKATLHARTLPRINASSPYLFTTSGTLSAPPPVPAPDACTGAVSIRYMLGKRTEALRFVPLQPNCTFTAQVLFHRLIHGRAQRLRVLVRFRGNHYLSATKPRVQFVRLGL
jgi:hypothetical protein